MSFHRRLLLSPSSPSPQAPYPWEDYLDQAFAVLLTTFFVFVSAYFVASVLWRLVHQCRRRQQGQQDGSATARAKQRTARSAELGAIPVIIYGAPTPSSTSSSSSSPGTDDCPVCLGEYNDGDEVRVLPQCKHMFHKHCIDRWLLTRSSSCPICRRLVFESLA